MGPAIVLSHGLTDSGLCWTRLVRALEDSFELIMLDARGHGESTGVPAGTAPDAARDLGEAIAALGLASPIVMGHSVGARATAAYANAHPDRVAAVILEDPPFLPLASPDAAHMRREKFRAQVERLRAMTLDEVLAEGRAISPAWHEDDLPPWATAKHRVHPAALPVYVTPWQAEIDRISAPTLLIHGEPALGGLVTPEIAAEATTINPNIRAVQIAKAGHNVRREGFAAYVAAVRNFLADIRLGLPAGAAGSPPGRW